jgi:hypothetical protein
MRGVTGVVEPNSREHSEVSASPKTHAFRAKIQLGAIYGWVKFIDIMIK